MPKAGCESIRVVPEPPSIESCNRTLDYEGWAVTDRADEIYTAGQIENFQTVFAFRNLIAFEIERLINILDALDGDHDLESNYWGMHNDPRLEDAEGDVADDEPSLGSLEDFDQACWAIDSRDNFFIDAELDESDGRIADRSGLRSYR
ncbi:MAG: hypothetical protein ACTHNN_19450 [Xanthobacteraceae bacterium]